MGEQYIDLFAAGAYALEGKLFDALAQPSLSWIFCLLAGAGIASSIVESALDGASDLWIRHLATVAVASVLIVAPKRIDLASLTYASPGTIEAIFGTHTGAAPHLTYIVERFGSTAAVRLRDLMHVQPVLAVPSIAAQVDELTSDPAILNDPQLKANLQIWRGYIVPALLRTHPDLKVFFANAGLVDALMSPDPPDSMWIGGEAARRGATVRAVLASADFDLASVVSDESSLLRGITDSAGADAWVSDQGAVRLRMSQAPPPTVDPPTSGAPAYYDAVMRGTSLAMSMINQLPQANGAIQITRSDQMHEMLGRSIVYVAAVSYLRHDSRLATLGSYCQRLGDAACRATQGSLSRTSSVLRVQAADRYNTDSFTTWLKQPLATILLAVASLLLAALSSLVVAVLPFLLGVAKAVAILMSTVGLWMLLWPGRFRDALSWIVLPISFVALWSLLFNLWADIEPFLSSVASVVGQSDHGSFSAGRIMSIGISIGYLGLPVLAISILSGNALRALSHAGTRLEGALLMAWRTRRTVVAFGRRWLMSSPLARRWNQRAYRAVGLGTLRSSRSSTRTRTVNPSGIRKPSSQKTSKKSSSPKDPKPE